MLQGHDDIYQLPETVHTLVCIFVYNSQLAVDEKHWNCEKLLHINNSRKMRQQQI